MLQIFMIYRQVQTKKTVASTFIGNGALMRHTYTYRVWKYARHFPSQRFLHASKEGIKIFFIMNINRMT